MNANPIFAGLMSLVISALVSRWLISQSRRLTLSNFRRELHHLHKTPTSRLGGLALVAAFAAVQFYLWLNGSHPASTAPLPVPALLGCVAMFALGFWDDLQPLGAKRKLAAQITIALGLSCSGIGIESFQVPISGQVISLGAWGVVVTVVWLVGMTNLINFIDGADGLAGGVSLMLMILLVYVGHAAGNLEVESAGMAGALLGFLYYNFPPARIYMGDGGAYFLGFQIGLFALLNSHKGEVLAALAAPMFVLALPILDTALAIARRGLRGLPIFRADARHLHHHLFRVGLSRSRVLLVFYGLTLVFLGMGLAVYGSRGKLFPLLLGAAVLVLLICARTFPFSRKWFAVGQIVADSLAMRERVQYALCLARLLELEGRRRRSVDELWPELVSAARRLGFVSVRLTSPGRPRLWERPGPPQSTLLICHNLGEGRFDNLELGAPVVPANTRVAKAHPARPTSAGASTSNGSATQGTFEILGELLAESWLKATRSCANLNPQQFNAPKAPLLPLLNTRSHPRHPLVRGKNLP